MCIIRATRYDTRAYIFMRHLVLILCINIEEEMYKLPVNLPYCEQPLNVTARVSVKHYKNQTFVKLLNDRCIPFKAS